MLWKPPDWLLGGGLGGNQQLARAVGMIEVCCPSSTPRGGDRSDQGVGMLLSF